MTVYTADCGGARATVRNNETETEDTIDHSQLLSLKFLGITSGDHLIIEEVHLRPRERNSLAQPYTFPELIQLRDNARAAGISISLFPNESTPKTRSMMGELEKSDEIDVRAIGNYLTHFPEEVLSLKRLDPITTDEHQRKHALIWEARSELNTDVNVARNAGYGFDSKIEYSDAISCWINNNAMTLYDRLGEELAHCIGIHKYKLKDQLKKIKSANRVYSIVATLLKPTGELRVRTDTEQLPEWKYVKKYYFCLSPYHRRGGVVASNYKYHMRPAISNFDCKIKVLDANGWRELKAARSEADRKLQVIWRTIRQLLIDQNPQY